jgi:hypothetical protein
LSACLRRQRQRFLLTLPMLVAYAKHHIATKVILARSPR